MASPGARPTVQGSRGQMGAEVTGLGRGLGPQAWVSRLGREDKCLKCKWVVTPKFTFFTRTHTNVAFLVFHLSWEEGEEHVC